MQYGWILGLLALAANSTPANAERLDGEAFADPGIVWQSVPSGWIQRPIAPEAEAQHADLVISLDQQLYPYLLPLIDDYAKTHGLTIATTKGTCGISAGLLFRKAIDIGGFCCAPGETDRLPGLRFHTLAIAAIAPLVHPDSPVEDVTLSQTGVFSAARSPTGRQYSSLRIRRQNNPMTPSGGFTVSFDAAIGALSSTARSCSARTCRKLAQLRAGAWPNPLRFG